LLPLAILALALAGCVWEGTGTINVRNVLCWGREITSLYIYETGVPDANNHIGSPLGFCDTHTEYGLTPGSWTVVAEIDGGPDVAVEVVVFDEGEWQPVWIDGSDIE
jgi:hypothetical protein